MKVISRPSCCFEGSTSTCKKKCPCHSAIEENRQNGEEKCKSPAAPSVIAITEGVDQKLLDTSVAGCSLFRNQLCELSEL